MALEDIYKSGEWTYQEYKDLAIEAKDDIQDIREEIFDEVTTDPLLNELNSTSSTALFNLWIDIWAFISWLLVTNWVRYENILNEAARASIPHNVLWYSNRSKEFQLGDVLDASTGAVIYPVIDESKQIIAAASVTETADGRVIIKVAKLSGELVALDASELLAFQGYISQIKDAGVITQIISQNSDLLNMLSDVFYDPIVPISTLQANVETAINEFLLQIPFDGILRTNDLISAIRAVEGVIDVDIIDLQASINYVTTPIFVPIDVFYETVAGYIKIDPNFPLSSQITYIPS